MKKKSLLIAMAAMSVAAIGAGTVSTMAWFQVGAANVNYTAGTSNQVATVTNPYTVGGFTLSLSFGDISNDIMPTDGSGNVKYYLADGNTLVTDSSFSGNKSAAFTITGTLTYTDDTSTSLDDTQIAAAWNQLSISSIDVTYSCSLGAKVKISTVDDNSAIGATAAAGAEKDNAFTTTNLTFNDKSANLGTTTLYVAVAAEESSVEASGNRGTITATPKVHD